MNQTNKAKGYVVEISHPHGNSVEKHIYTAIEEAKTALEKSGEEGRIYRILSKHSEKADGFIYILSDGKPSAKVYSELIDADQARKEYLFAHSQKEPGKVVALEIEA
ncbi:MAG: hypothetical protein HUJ94_03055 [Bacteroidales bacterium]|nr:hypothetical protein [Bacteroidales bacterium]